MGLGVADVEGSVHSAATAPGQVSSNRFANTRICPHRFSKASTIFVLGLKTAHQPPSCCNAQACPSQFHCCIHRVPSSYRMQPCPMTYGTTLAVATQRQEAPASNLAVDKGLWMPRRRPHTLGCACCCMAMLVVTTVGFAARPATSSELWVHVPVLAASRTAATLHGEYVPQAGRSMSPSIAHVVTAHDHSRYPHDARRLRFGTSRLAPGSAHSAGILGAFAFAAAVLTAWISGICQAMGQGTPSIGSPFPWARRDEPRLAMLTTTSFTEREVQDQLLLQMRRSAADPETLRPLVSQNLEVLDEAFLERLATADV